MRLPKVVGSSSEKPLVRRLVSNSSSTRSFTVLSLLSASARFRSSCTRRVEQNQHARYGNKPKVYLSGLCFGAGTCDGRFVCACNWSGLTSGWHEVLQILAPLINGRASVPA